MQTAMHPAFKQKLAVLAALLERSKSARAQAHSRGCRPTPRYQTMSNGNTWNVIETATGVIQGHAYSYRTAMQFVDALEAGSADKDERA